MEEFRDFISTFITVDDDDWMLYEKSLETGVCKKGDIFLKIGEVCTSLHFITKGCARIFCYKKENEETYDFVFENDFAVDYRSFLTARPSTVGIEALEDLEYVKIPKKELEKLTKTSLKMQEFGRIMTEMVYIYLDERLQSILYDEPIDRYKKLLNKDAHLLQRVELQYIASYLGVRPETLSRLRKKLSLKPNSHS
jgi:CRP/FNR family transcriptional regulator, anaerobic regulatory protein